MAPAGCFLRGLLPLVHARRAIRGPGGLFFARPPAVRSRQPGHPSSQPLADSPRDLPDSSLPVADSFQIMKFEWTNAQYVQFLNAVDASGTNPNAVYNTNMDSNPRGGISFTSGASDGSKYAAKTNMGEKPVNFVSWFDAARVANWLQNGQGSGSTETGAYTGNWICWQHWQLCELRQWSRLEQPDRQPDDSGHQRRAESIRHV